MSDSDDVEGLNKPTSGCSTPDDSCNQRGSCSSDLTYSSELPCPSYSLQTEARRITDTFAEIHRKDLPAVPGNRKEEFNLCADMFKMIEVIQNNKLYRLAFSHYFHIANHFSTDALYWLRLAECCIYARYQRDEKKPELEETTGGLIACFIDDFVPNHIEKELDDLGMTMEYAEMAARNCELLLKGYPPLEGMVAHINTLIAFIHLKSHQVSFAQQYLDVALQNHPEGIFLITALVMQIHILLQQWEFEKAVKFYKEMKDSQRDECKKYFSNYIRDLLSNS